MDEAQLRPRHRVLLLAGSLGPLGHAPASGTVTVAVVGIPLFAWMDDWHAGVFIAFTVVFAAASVWMHHLGDRYLGEKDSRKLVWDELAGFFVAIAFVPFTWPLAILAFLLERVFDIAKVPPANVIERRVPGGWGVVGDDIIAGLYTCGLLHLLMWLFPEFLGVAGDG